MPVLYRYTAKNMEGKSVRGTAEAEDYDALYAQLLGQGLYLQSASKGFGGGGKALKSRQLADFCRELSTLLAAGVSLVRALTIISEQEGLNASEKRLYASILAEVRKGANLSSALEAQGVFPPLCLGMVRAGEGSGQLDRVTDRLARHYDSEHRLNQQLKSALTYPIILGILAVAVVIILVTFVLPQFNDLFANMDSLPATTLALMAASDFMTTRWYVVVMAVVVLVIAVQALLRVAEVKFAVDKMALTMPVFGRLNSVICTARFARTLSSLYSSGMPIVQALTVARGTIGNVYIDSQFDLVLASVRQGANLSDALDQVDGFVRKLVSSIRIGEETGQLDAMLDSIADAMDYDAREASKRMMTMLEPMLIIIMAFVVGFIIVAVMSPIIGSYGAIESSGNV